MKPDTATASASPARPSRSAAARFARWAAWDGLRETWRQAQVGWIKVPTATKIRYAATMGIGFIACAIVVAAMALTAKWWAPRGLAAWDERVLRAIDAQTVLSLQNAVLLESFGNLVYLIPLVVGCAIVAARRRKPVLAVTFVASYVLARPLVILGWWLWDRARPDLILDGKLSPPLHSFPSGHAALSVSVYGVLAYLWVRVSRSWVERAVAVALAAAIVGATSLARVRIGTHWPSDIVAGWIIGVLWLAVVLAALHRPRELV